MVDRASGQISVSLLPDGDLSIRRSGEDRAKAAPAAEVEHVGQMVGARRTTAMSRLESRQRRHKAQPGPTAVSESSFWATASSNLQERKL